MNSRSIVLPMRCACRYGAFFVGQVAIYVSRMHDFLLQGSLRRDIFCTSMSKGTRPRKATKKVEMTERQVWLLVLGILALLGFGIFYVFFDII